MSKTSFKDVDWFLVVTLAIFVSLSLGAVAFGISCGIRAAYYQNSPECELERDSLLFERYYELIDSGTSPDVAAEIVFGSGE